MKFGLTLFNNAVPEWRPAYVDYERLKKKLQEISNAFPRTVRNLHPRVTTDVSPDFKTEEEVEEEERLEAISNSNEEKAFMLAVDAELDKVNKFFLEQDDKARKTCDDLEAQLAALYVAHQTGGEHAVAAVRSKNARRRARAVLRERRARLSAKLTWWCHKPSRILNSQTKQLEKAFQEYYRNLDMLRAYRNLNNTAFYKIMKKHDKVTGLTMSPTVLAKVSAAPFMTSDLEKEIRRIEQVFTERLEHGDRRRAMQKLRVPVDAFQPFDWTTFGLGLWAMFFFFCMGIILVVALRSRVADYPDHRVMFAMYRGLLYPLIMLAFVAINMYTWRKFHVNYVLIFGLDHRRHTNYIKMLGTAGLLMAVWSVSVFAYLFQDELGTTVRPWSAVALLCVLVAYWAKPWGSMRRARYWLARVVGRMVAAPFFDVRFEDFWLADQFNSLVVILLDLQFTICYVSKSRFGPMAHDGHHCRSSENVLRAVIAALPAWWRLMQCLRRFRDTRKYHHIHNALKYSSSVVVVIFSTLAGVAKDNGQLVGESPTGTALFVMWILACLVNTSYSAFWDLKHDWGLFAKNAKHMWLRRDMLYPVPIYYLAMVNDVVFRLSWTLSISVGYFDLFFSDGLVALLSFFEMWRRFVWNFFRVENEHVNNCGEFRAVRHIPLPFEYVPAETEWELLRGHDGSQRRPPFAHDSSVNDAFGGGRPMSLSVGSAAQHARSHASLSGYLASPQHTRDDDGDVMRAYDTTARQDVTVYRSDTPGSLYAPPGGLDGAAFRLRSMTFSHPLDSTLDGLYAANDAAGGDVDDDDDDDDPSRPLLGASSINRNESSTVHGDYRSFSPTYSPLSSSDD
ncbi:xenotropic and polytropic murine leukemia virus receptor xpr1 [Salpingoeca rosetta]|uniref:Xenotropic and polytropic murine leukemia virus receptor xpr1 n=1 Tax=Salpingoeca rosetta (strain ATCC 50818 / BSB-021) TaxID=946362 RepID=F2TVK7_SALR5|nr:xenotropic and polytropic murine leukemia virus receptor xpr1 [Salpingoeca rosetta]EGD72103.1 xenotropic and polytropic murine leukemia virus receptor xpr1 [Salpingoeca rosetta]|eukprot:XP_004998675.1 xenotropic and polytropic murine leukemia virus receptor xpr1 [Salpingoeca rosetta]